MPTKPTRPIESFQRDTGCRVSIEEVDALTSLASGYDLTQLPCLVSTPTGGPVKVSATTGGRAGSKIHIVVGERYFLIDVRELALTVRDYYLESDA